MDDLKIELLADHPGTIPALTGCYEAEWEPYYGENGPGDARADLSRRCNRGELPIGLVALEDDRPVGAVALDLDVATDLTPSVVGLFVAPDCRRRGIAKQLIEAAEELARSLGYGRIYVSTSLLGDMLQRLGWEVMGAVEFLNAEQGCVYVREL